VDPIDEQARTRYSSDRVFNETRNHERRTCRQEAQLLHRGRAMPRVVEYFR